MTALGKLGHQLVATGVVSLGRLKVAAIVLPAAALFVMVILLRSSLHIWLHESPGFFVLSGVFAVCVFLFASVVFAVVEDLEGQIVDQNRRLSDLLARTDRQNTELSAFLSVGRATTSSVELSDMLDQAFEAVLEVTHAEAAELWLEENGRLTLEHFRGVGEVAFASKTPGCRELFADAEGRAKFDWMILTGYGWPSLGSAISVRPNRSILVYQGTVDIDKIVYFSIPVPDISFPLTRDRQSGRKGFHPRIRRGYLPPSGREEHIPHPAL